jgi:acyl carrier protein
MATAHTPKVRGSFPAKEVETSIRDALKSAHDDQQILRPRVVSACEPQIDSLVVIEVICAIEELLGIELPTSFAPRGGYRDIDSCVSDLMSETRAVWLEVVKETEESHA